MYGIRKLLNLLFFIAVYIEVKKNVNSQQNDLFLVRYSLSNYLIIRYLHCAGHKMLLEVHGLAHIEEKEYGQSYMPPFYYGIVACFEKRMLGWADEIITGSGSSRDSLADIGINAERIHVVHNGFAPDKFNSLADPEEVVQQYNLGGKMIIGFVGSFARYHGFEILLSIAENLHKKYQNIGFLLVGRNVHGSDSQLEKVLATRLAHLFTFTGEVPHSRVQLLIAAMHIAIIPDSNTYGSPMKLFEYMAMRKAVVAPDVPPILEIIEDGETGIVFERGNLEGAVKAVEKLIEDDSLRRHLGQRAYAKVIDSYTWGKRAERIAMIAEKMTE